MGAHPPEDRDRVCQGCYLAARYGRRSVLKLLALGLSLLAAGCASGQARALRRVWAPRGKKLGPSAQRWGAHASPPGLDPEKVEVIWSGPPGSDKVALTLDDGLCRECVEGYVQFAYQSGVPLTLNPNGVNARSFSRETVELCREMAQRGQMQFGNHTFTHQDLTRMRPARVRWELVTNEEWIQDTFFVSTRPFYRPPYGRYNLAVAWAAAEVGFTKTLMWNGTLGDATPESPAQILSLARHWIRPGSVVLGHLNHPQVLGVLGEILQIIRERGLTAVTLDDLLGVGTAVV
jgi:hypothetical protein